MHPTRQYVTAIGAAAAVMAVLGAEILSPVNLAAEPMAAPAADRLTAGASNQNDKTRQSGKADKANKAKGRKRGDVGVVALAPDSKGAAAAMPTDLKRVARNPQVDVIGVAKGEDLRGHWDVLPDGWKHWRPDGDPSKGVAWRTGAVPDLRDAIEAAVRPADVQPRHRDPSRGGGNDWSANPEMRLRALKVSGVSFVPGIRDDADVHKVLKYVARQYHRRVEPLVDPGNWGYNHRVNRNDPAELSEHATGTAIDINAPKHPNGVPAAKTFTPAQIDEIRKILREVDPAVRWGGDFDSTPDAMHFEITADKRTVAAVADRLRNDGGRSKSAAADDRRFVKMIHHAIRKKGKEVVELDA